MVRDIVEIVAIVAAGIWAFYVFVYENRIKPTLQPPDVTITGSIERIGRVHGLDTIRLTTAVNNVGSTAIIFLAYSVTVTGARVALSKTPVYIMHTPTLTHSSGTFASLIRSSFFETRFSPVKPIPAQQPDWRCSPRPARKPTTFSTSPSDATIVLTPSSSVASSAREGRR